MAEVGLYIHVPFCATKCGYCDFYSHMPVKGAFDPLVDAVLTELGREVLARDVRVVTIFVGGGTPTLLPAGPLGRLMSALRAIVERDRPVEFTVEANPASLTDVKAAILRDAGVNRVSMGAQSFHAHELRVLDRIHNPQDIPLSAEIIRRTGFEHFNLDLIFGIPGQTAASWRESIRRAAELGPDHLACYGLTYESGTPLRDRLDAGLITPSPEESEADRYLDTIDYLSDLGFEQYEISNFARAGARSEHNLRYWHNQPVIGLGPSAASYHDGRRTRNVPDTAEYVRRINARESPAIETEVLDPLARAGESAMLRLRLREGIDRAQFHEATGFDLVELFSDPIARHTAAGLLEVDDAGIRLTRGGLLLADTILAEFLDPEPPATRRDFAAKR